MSNDLGTLLMIAQLAFKLTLLLAAVAIVDVALLRRHASAATRHLLWTCALIGAMVLPLLNGVLPAIHVSVRTNRSELSVETPRLAQHDSAHLQLDAATARRPAGDFVGLAAPSSTVEPQSQTAANGQAASS